MTLRFLRILCVVFSLVFVASPAFAMTLDQARSSGAVGEKTDGYVAVLKAEPEVQALVSDINAKRRQEYERISKNTGQSVDVVAKLAAQQIMEKLASGSLYQAPDNTWKKR